MNSQSLIQAQAQAAELCITILTDAGLIGDNLITKLPAARAAILACLSKMYAACRQVEAETGKNMYRVNSAVMQMFGRSNWAAHDKMMDLVEASFRAFIAEGAAFDVVEEAPALEVGQPVIMIDGRTGTVQQIDQNGVKVRMACDTYSITTDAKNMAATGPAPTPVADVEPANPVAELVKVAKDSREGLIARIQRYTSTQFAIGLDKLNEYIITSQLGTVAYQVTIEGLKPCQDLIFAPGSLSAADLEEGLPEGFKVVKRIHAMQDVTKSSEAALKQIENFLKGVKA